MALWFRRTRGRVEIQRKDGKPPWPQHVFVWLEDESERQLALFGQLLEKLAPGPVDRIVLGSRPTEQQTRALAAYPVPVAPARLGKLLRDLSSQNLQLYWGPEGPEADLAIICELYDDHIEICVPEQRQELVRAALAGYENCAA